MLELHAAAAARTEKRGFGFCNRVFVFCTERFATPPYRDWN